MSDDRGESPGAVEAARRRPEAGIDITAMASSLVHEIKNPLSTLNLNAQLLLEEWREPKDPREERTVKRLRIIRDEVQRLERIVQTFLRFAERHELALEEASLNDLLEELAEFIAPEASRNGIQVRLGLDTTLPRCRFDPDLLRQVFLNILQNAIHAMEGKGGELILRTGVRPRDGRVWVFGEVTDTGPGIPTRNLERVFDLYYSTKKNGSGLGLAISKRIVEEHGGCIEVASAEGKGSQFRVYLPADGAQNGD